MNIIIVSNITFAVKPILVYHFHILVGLRLTMVDLEQVFYRQMYSDYLAALVESSNH